MQLPDSDNWTFTEWIEAQTALQVAGGKPDPRDIDGLELEKDFIRWNMLAATDELHEALQETDWKPWTMSKDGHHRELFLGEMVDAMHFMANLFRFFGIDGEEITAAYKKKAQKNLDRWAAGYTGQDKCGICRRDNTEIPEYCDNSHCPSVPIQGAEQTSTVACWITICNNLAEEMVEISEVTPGGTTQTVRVLMCSEHAKAVD